MPRSAASIQAEITAIEARLSAASGLVQSVGADGASVTNYERTGLEKRLDQLYLQLERASGSAPMFVRGVVKWR